MGQDVWRTERAGQDGTPRGCKSVPRERLPLAQPQSGEGRRLCEVTRAVIASCPCLHELEPWGSEAASPSRGPQSLQPEAPGTWGTTDVGLGASTFCSACPARPVGARLAGPGTQGDLQGSVRAPARLWGLERVTQEKQTQDKGHSRRGGAQGKACERGSLLPECHKVCCGLTGGSPHI